MTSSLIYINAILSHLNSCDLVWREVWNLLEERSLVIVAGRERGPWLHLQFHEIQQGFNGMSFCAQHSLALEMEGWGGVGWGEKMGTDMSSASRSSKPKG